MADQDFLLLAHDGGNVNDEELILLFDLNRSRNLDLPYWKYLDHLETDECISEFRFEKEDIFTLCHILQLPDRLVCYNGTSVSSIEALCIFLKRCECSLKV